MNDQDEAQILCDAIESVELSLGVVCLSLRQIRKVMENLIGGENEQQ
jgi:hypothetical protein